MECIGHKESVKFGMEVLEGFGKSSLQTSQNIHAWIRKHQTPADRFLHPDNRLTAG